MSSPAPKGAVNSTESASPDKRAVAEFHRNSDLNSRPEAQHHTLGNGANEGAYGNHNHDGQRGVPLLDGITFTGSRTNNVASILDQICDALERIGAINSTGG